MIGDKLPFRFGSLDVDDGTVRRLDVLSGPERADYLDRDTKRVYRKVWTVRVSSELPVTTMRQVHRAIETNLTLIDLGGRTNRDLTQSDTAAAVESEVVS